MSEQCMHDGKAGPCERPAVEAEHFCRRHLPKKSEADLIKESLAGRCVVYDLRNPGGWPACTCGHARSRHFNPVNGWAHECDGDPCRCKTYVASPS